MRTPGRTLSHVGPTHYTISEGKVAGKHGSRTYGPRVKVA